LPQQIGHRLLKTLRRPFGADRRYDTAMASQNLVNRRQRRRLEAIVLQTAGDLARAPVMSPG
jgi:hypothetical protein